MPSVEGTIVDEALEEIVEAFENIEPLLEGLKDFSRLNIQPDTMAIVQAAIAEHERRAALLQAGKVALEALLADGYPLLPVHEIPQSAYADLSDNHTSIDAAYEHFTPITATDLGLTEGEAEAKPEN